MIYGARRAASRARRRRVRASTGECYEPADMRTFRVLFVALALSACGAPASPQTAPHGSAALDRLRFNQLAMRLDLPLFWAVDADQDGAPDPDEVRSLRFYETSETWVDASGAFTPAYHDALSRIRAEAEAPPPADERLRWVRQELDHAAPTLIATDLGELPPAHRGFAEHMLEVAALIDQLYARQTGMEAMRPRLGDDPASRSLFRRNWGPECRGATTEAEPACSAIDGAPRQPVDVYPSALQADDSFCEPLESRPDAAELTTPFTVVREREGALVAVPYHEAYAELMQPIARELRAAADAIAADPEEAALVAYLRAAAGSFESNDWGPADEAWSRMSVRNSAWYVRVGPDETYWDPCSLKAGFHLTLARIDRASLEWQERLQPIQADMERALAGLAPEVYTARDVSFHMPDFIAIVVNAGDDRDAFGATIGQSLPNWGAVANEGRGRTVAMSNLYTDPDSLARRRAAASTMLSAESMARYSDSATPGLLSTILHEATHNLGPSHEYRVEGRTADEAFGGGMASMLEELKAQSGALFYLDWLRERGVLTTEQVEEAYVDSVVWALGHVSRGMYTPSGQRKAYSQLAAIQLGALMEEGAVRWDPSARSADGHEGAYTIDFARFPAAARSLMARVMHIKATNDRPAAEALAARYVDGDLVPMTTITERWRAFPQATFVYSVDLD